MTPLSRKLGVRQGQVVAVLNAPRGYRKTLGRPHGGVTFLNNARSGVDLIQYFATSSKDLSRDFPLLLKSVKASGAIWVSWPKRASGLPSDLSDREVRSIGLMQGLVDVEVCAVDANWSGLKFVRRASSPGMVLNPNKSSRPGSIG